ncbi:MAG: hypothetical protein B6D79_05445 [gamma proteobacterium symbiont of Ctena orbiculata]|nr:MAG: hypothetical protein B6D79_05445 [gamma proteobacterium symbiont of Ctena orbiculata]
MVKIGSNKFEDVAFPLAFANRYFMLEATVEPDVWTVFTVKGGKPIIEILKNEPMDNDLSNGVTNPAGIVTVSDPQTGAFQYKLRTGNKNSSVFGRINGEEIEIKITDKEIRIGTNTFQGNIVSGFAVGIIVDENGGIGMGAGLPPELKQLFKT